MRLISLNLKQGSGQLIRVRLRFLDAEDIRRSCREYRRKLALAMNGAKAIHIPRQQCCTHTRIIPAVPTGYNTTTAVTAKARHALITLIIALAVPLSASGVGACTPSPADGSVTIRIFAASSLTDALTESVEEFTRTSDNVIVETHFAASSRLRAQIEEGAGADVFISADPVHIAAISDLLVESSITTVASNRMVVAAGTSSDEIQTLADLAEPGVKIVIALPDVPAGRYARELITNLAQQEEFESGFDDAVLANVVSEETNVRAVLAKALLGEADAGFVYATDVRGTDLRVLDIPGQDDGDIAYVGAIVSDSVHQDTAQSFLEFLTAEPGQQILTSHGFLAPPTVPGRE